jgi:hypothetical protein
MALLYDASIKLGKRAVIDAIAATLDALGDPLDKIWIEDASAGRHTYTVKEALAVLDGQAGFRYLWAVPMSERRNKRSNWLSAVMVDNLAVNSSMLFFALPRGLSREFGPHVTLLESLVEAAATPQYGWAYTCQYDNPDYFAFDYAYNTRVRLIEQPKWQRQILSNYNRASNPDDQPDRRRRAGGLILDVFPINILSDLHLRQKIGDSSLKEWILLNTGSNSLTQISPGCFIWRVPAAQTAAVATQLEQLGLTLRDRVMAVGQNGPTGVGATTSSRSSPHDRAHRPASAPQPTLQRPALAGKTALVLPARRPGSR